MSYGAQGVNTLFLLLSFNLTRSIPSTDINNLTVLLLLVEVMEAPLLQAVDMAALPEAADMAALVTAKVAVSPLLVADLVDHLPALIHSTHYLECFGRGG